jgi:protoporphyrinogen oxidase
MVFSLTNISENSSLFLSHSDKSIVFPIFNNVKDSSLFSLHSKKLIIKKEKIYDYVIIGAGISGLYCAYNILQKNPNSKIIILEKNNKIGGRIGKETFEGVQVVIGAGIGRKNKDNLLINLLNKLHIKYNEFISNHKVTNLLYSTKSNKKSSIINTQNIFYYLKKKYKDLSTKKTFKNNINFKKFAINILGKDKYNNFKVSSGYTDYENSDINDFLENYNYDDNYSKYIGLNINWNTLKERLYKKIITNNKNNIVLNSNVYKLRFDKKTNNYKIFYKNIKNKKTKKTKNLNKNIIYSNKVIIASTIDTVQKLIPNCAIYKDIKPNSFIRIYAKFSNESINIMKKNIPTTMYVKGFLQKIIPINHDKGIYMIAYADNKNANHLEKIINKFNNKKEINNKIILYKYFENLLTRTLNLTNNDKKLIKITNITHFYWKIGTHYYLPLKKEYKDRNDFIEKAQNPAKNLFVIGECVALNQGWTNGALQSVENIKNKL